MFTILCEESIISVDIMLGAVRFFWFTIFVTL